MQLLKGQELRGEMGHMYARAQSGRTFEKGKKIRLRTWNKVVGPEFIKKKKSCYRWHVLFNQHTGSISLSVIFP